MCGRPATTAAAAAPAAVDSDSDSDAPVTGATIANLREVALALGDRLDPDHLLSRATNHLAPGTRATYRSCLSSFVVALNSARSSASPPRSVFDFLLDYRKNLAQLLSVLVLCRKCRRFSLSPSELTFLKLLAKKPSKRGETRCPSLDLVLRTFAHGVRDPTPIQFFALFAVVFGCRVGILDTLRAQDFSFVPFRVSLRAQKTSPPTIREVLPPFLPAAAVLRQWVRDVVDSVPDQGEPLLSYFGVANTSVLSELFRSATRRRFHLLRHCFATTAFKDGVPHADIERVGGWAPGSTTLRSVYLHRDVAERWSDVDM